MIAGPGLSILRLAAGRAAWARQKIRSGTPAPLLEGAASQGAPEDLFEIQRVADGVYFAFARPQGHIKHIYDRLGKS